MKEITQILLDRYRPLCNGWLRLGWMLNDLEENAETWPIDRITLQIGQVQGALWMKGKLDMDSEIAFVNGMLDRYHQLSESKK